MCQRHLRPQQPALLGNLAQPVDDFFVILLRSLLHTSCCRIGSVSGHASSFPLPTPASVARASGLHGIRRNAPLPRTIPASPALLRDRAGCNGPASETNRVQPLSPRKIKRLCKLPRKHRRRAEIQHFARLHHIVQRLRCLLDRRPGSPAQLNLIEVNVVGAEQLEL